MATSAIEWTDAVWNPVAGCSIVSPGCHNCYAMTMAARLEAMGQEKYRGLTKKPNCKALWTGKITLDEEALSIPLKRRKHTMYFVNSMSDLFHDGVPDEFIDRVFATMAQSQQHVFQILTKRPQRMLDYCRRVIAPPGRFSRLTDKGVDADRWKAVPLPNVWLGVSVEDQQRADERIPLLLQTPAAVRFLSCEPLLDSVTLDADWLYWRCKECGRHEPYCDCFPNTTKRQPLGWCIVGGESGHGARPMDVAWARSLIEQCQSAGIPVFMKQIGSHPFNKKSFKLKDKKGGDINEFPDDLRVREFPTTSEQGATHARAT